MNVPILMRVGLAPAIASFTLLLPVSAMAQSTYPAQSVRIICPFPAGGGTDVTARLLAEQLQKSLGQSFIVDNRPGASAMIGTRVVAKSAAPDGYTLLVTAGEVALNPHLYAKMAYDWEKDLQPISLLVKVPNVLVVNTDVPAKSVAELIAYARQQPAGKLTFSSSGVGNPQQLTGELFNKMAGVTITHVPYGSALQVADVAGKHITMTFISIAAVQPFIESGKLRPLGVTSASRVSALPEVPAIAEYPPMKGFELVNFFGMFGPAGMPAPVLRRLNDTVAVALQTKAVAARLREMGFEPSPDTPEQFREFVKGESAKFARIISDAKIKLEQ